MTISRIPFIVVLTLFLTIALSATSCSSPGNINSLDNIRMTVTINGLEKGDEATLTLSLSPGIDPAEKPLFQQTIRSAGERSLTVEITTSLKDGYYQLLLKAPDRYFREPKGYLFQVYQSQIVNPVRRSVIFSLLSKEGAPEVEALISLSGPVKQLPYTPLIRGLISGLLYSDAQVRIRYSTISGSKKGYSSRWGNGNWEAVITTHQSEYYTITAEAEGYKVYPESYLVLIVGDTAYVVSGNETDEEALHLDFHFIPEEP